MAVLAYALFISLLCVSLSLAQSCQGDDVCDVEADQPVALLQLLKSPFWFARKFTNASFAEGWDPVALAAASWETEKWAATAPWSGEEAQTLSMVGAERSVTEIGGQCDAAILAALQGRGPGLIIAGQGGSSTRAAQEIVGTLMRHDFGELGAKSKDSLATRRAHLLEPGYFSVGLRQTGSVSYEVDKLRPLALHNQISHRVCDSFTRLHASIEHSSRLWALKEPWLRLLLPFFDRAIGTTSYKFLHVVHDVRNIHHTHEDEGFASAFQKTHEDNLEKALQSAMAVNSTIRSRWAVSADVARWVMFAYVWGHVELQLHEWWTRERPQNYFLLTEVGMASFQRPDGTARELATFLGDADPTQALLDKMGRVYETPRSSSYANEHFEMMDAIVKLPGMERARKAMQVFGYV